MDEYGILLDDFCENAGVFPTQFSSENHQSGERRLMLAVLKKAVRDLLTYSQVDSKRGRRQFRRAEAYFRSNDSTHLYSFNSICRTFGRDPKKSAAIILNKIS